MFVKQSCVPCAEITVGFAYIVGKSIILGKIIKDLQSLFYGSLMFSFPSLWQILQLFECTLDLCKLFY